MRNQLRTKTVGCKMTESEHALLQSLADRQNKALSEWCREALLAYAQDNQKPGPDLARASLEEVLALRSIVSTILYHLANGQKLTDDQMRSLIEKADQSKGQRADEVLGRPHKRQEAE